MDTKKLGKFSLYYRGHWDKSLFTKCIGIVGSRRMSDYGRQVVAKIVPQLVLDGWTIVSGFMYGVDITAHQSCLDCGGKTIAVLGWGINYQRDTEDEQLLRTIIDSGGLILSLWDNQMGTNWTFPARNRVVADICHELIVIEAANRSGALLTATMVRNLHKKVWAVPGPITSSVSVGTNQLIAEGLATPWTNGHIQLPLQSSKPPDPIVSLLQNSTLETGEIARALNQPVSDIAAQLSLLTLQGSIIEKNGKYYAS